MKDSWAVFQKYLITDNVVLDIWEFILNAAIVVVLTFILQHTYIRCAKSLSNKKVFANNFLILTFTTMIIITIVKSSLELSLGLVGALSIVRFRAAIKEPEELAYLFFTIAIGLGLGANQRMVVLVSFGLLMVILWGKYFLSARDNVQTLFLTVSTNSKKLKYSELESLIGSHFNRHELKRYDENEESMEVAYYLDIKNKASLASFKDAVQTVDSNVRVAFIDNKI